MEDPFFTLRNDLFRPPNTVASLKADLHIDSPSERDTLTFTTCYYPDIQQITLSQDNDEIWLNANELKSLIAYLTNTLETLER